MSPGNWLLCLGLIGFVILCCMAGFFIEIARDLRELEQAESDAEAMLRAAPHDNKYRPRVRAGTNQ